MYGGGGGGGGGGIGLRNGPGVACRTSVALRTSASSTLSVLSVHTYARYIPYQRCNWRRGKPRRRAETRRRNE